MEQLEREVYEFPTQIPLKVIGRNEDEFEAYVVDLFRAKVGAEEIASVSSHPSSGDTYLSVTVTFVARSREQLDSIYAQLSESKRVKIVI